MDVAPNIAALELANITILTCSIGECIADPSPDYGGWKNVSYYPGLLNLIQPIRLPNIRARHVAVYRSDGTQLSIIEVEVFGM